MKGQSPLATKEIRVCSTAESAWLIKEILLIGLILRGRGFCIGEIPLTYFGMHGGGLERARLSAVRESLESRIRAKLHLLRGHDVGCLRTGVPHSSLRRMIKSSTRRGDRKYLEEIALRLYRDEENPGGAVSADLVVELFARSISTKRPKAFASGGAQGNKKGAR